MNQGNFNTDKKTTSEDEIDLSKLFKSFIQGIAVFLKGLLRVLFLFIDTVIANVTIFIVLSVLGALIGLAFYFGTKPYYESNMTLGSAYYRGQLIKNSIENLNSLCKEGNYKSLAKVLKIPQKQAKDLKRIEIQPVISPNLQLIMDMYKENEGSNRHLDSLILQNQDTTFQVLVQVYDTMAINGLGSSLVNYLKENQYVKKRIEIERANLKSRRAKLIKESGSLDTLKRNIALSYRNQAGGRSGTNNVILDDKGTNPIDIYREDLRLYEQQLKIERLLYINSEIEVIDPFIAFGESQSGTIEKNILKGLLLGLLISFIIIFFKILRIGIIKLRFALQETESE
jgi:hypothetical protein